MLKVRDRQSGALVPERVFGERELNWLYGTRAGRFVARRLASRRTISRLYGLAKRSRWSKRQIRPMIAALGIDASESEFPVHAYRSVDDFFARKLRVGARPIEPDPSCLISPCDGRALVFPSLPHELRVKGTGVTLAALLGDASLARRARSAVVIRLAPCDYHRFHFPVSGSAGPARRVAGRLHSVHPIATSSGAPSLLNARCVTAIAAAHIGELLMVEVGALCVGTIEQTYLPGRVTRGQEKGLFRFGGSTVILIALDRAVSFNEDLIVDSAKDVEVLVRMGTEIGKRGKDG